MPLHIDRVEAELDVLPPGGPEASPPPLPSGQGLAPGEAEALKEQLRPIVIEILNEELERLRRRQG